MPDSRTEVRFPLAKVVSPISENEAVSSMCMTLSVDTCPTVEFTTHPKKPAAEGAISITNSDVAATIGKGQKIIFSARDAPDTTLTVEDGAGGKLVFKGFYSNPSYSFSYGSTGMQQMALHESSMLDAIVPEIYASVDPSAWITEYDRLETRNLADRIWQLQKRIVDTWNRHKIDDIPEKESLIAEKINGVNQVLFPAWKRVLDNSRTSLGWEEIEGLENAQMDKLDDTIKSALLQQSDSFFSNMLRFNSLFQAVWVPSMEAGQYGSYIRRRNLFENVRDIQVTPINLRFAGGSSRLLPITHCVVYMGEASFWATSDNGMGSVPASIVAAWPETSYGGGRILRDPGPPWLGGVTVPDTALDDTTDDRLDLSAYMGKKDEVKEDTVKTSYNTCLTIASEWAKDIYNWTALSGATANMDIPMDVTILPGQYLSVSNSEGLLFKGFVNSVVHELIAGDSGNSGRAVTSLSFSNVEATGFELPNRK